MAKPERRAYVTPDVKQYGAVEEVTQATWKSGPGDLLSLLHEIISGEEAEGCPIWKTCAS